MMKKTTLSAVKAGGIFTRLMMKTAAAPYEHHLRIRGTPNPSNFTAVPAAAAKAKATATAKTTTETTTTTTARKGIKLTETLGDPCLDLFFGVEGNPPKSEKYRLLKQLLPAAWSHDPLTTLKLICNLLDSPGDFGKSDPEWFYRAAVWLHHNHPKTLASNVLPIFSTSDNAGYLTIGSLDDLAEILKRLTESGTWISESEDYRLLLDRYSDMFADHLRSNLEDMNNQQPLRHYDCDLSMDCAAGRTTFLLFGESIAKKLFPRESYPEYQGLEESLYVDTVRDRLRDEVLAPLFEYEPPPPPSDSDSDSEDSDPAAGYALPNVVISIVDRDLAQRYWERMMKDVYLKQGKFNNCLVVCNVGAKLPGTLAEAMALSLAVLVSQVSGGPWKGKVINAGPNPELHDLPGSDLDLVANCAFLRRMDYGFKVDIPKVFDVILQAAANANLPPDLMVKKVFFVDGDGFDDLAEDSWESDYQAILTQYKEKGYGQDAVPQFVHWNVNAWGYVKAPRSRPGLTTLTGYSMALFQCFLDNGGQFGPHHVVEAAICGSRYQDMIVID